MSKHAAGPWGIRITDSGAWAIFNVDGSWIAQTTRKHLRGLDEEKATARLIAAAPDLLEALEAMEKRGDWNGANWAIPAEVWRAASAAIAKAKGEA